MTTARGFGPVPAEPPGCGVPPEQVHVWLEHVQEDLRRVRARVEFLRAEQLRLESQHHLLAELLASTADV